MNLSKTVNKCNECDGGCEGFKLTKKSYYHFIFKYDIVIQNSKRTLKPNSCDFCNKITNIEFMNEPFCADVLDIHCPFWFCNDCYKTSAENF